MPPGCDMTSKKTLNTRNLEALGAERLAELLIQISKARPAARRLLRLELAGAQGTAELAREVRHRMATIRRSRAVIDSRRRRDLVDDLELCRRTIVDRIAVEDAAEVLDLMWQYMGLANPIQNRLHYTDETIAGAFSASDPGAIASAASPDPRKLGDRAFEALTQNAHGQFDGLIGALSPALGQDGLERLKQLMTEYSNTPALQLPEAHRRKIHWRHRGTDVEAETAERLRLQTARSALQDIYCARGQAENLIKLHKGQLASDRTSCQSPLANQFRLVLHTAAYWLMLALRDAVPRRMPLAWAEFATLRKNLLKIGARVVERAARIRIHFASAFPDAALFRLLAGRLAASGP